MTAIDPRPGSQLAYIATTEATVQTGANQLTGKCITGKRIRVFRSTDMGATWSDMPGSDSLPQGAWATDPDISVGVDGTVFLTLLLTTSYTSCATTPTFGTDGLDVQLWTAPPNGTLQPAFAGGNPFVGGVDRPSADFPQIAASTLTPGQVAIAWVQSPGDQVATFQRNANGTYSEVHRFTLNSQGLFPNLSIDLFGDLYVATNEPRVQRFAWIGNAWTFQTQGFPPIMGSYAHTIPMTLPSSQSANFLSAPSLAMAVTRIGESSDHIVYVAFEVINTAGQRQIELVASNSFNLNLWTAPTLVPLPAGSLIAFHPSLAGDITNNLVDLLVYDLQGTSGGPLSALSVKTFFYRFNASNLALDVGPALVSLAGPSVSDLPARHSDLPSSLFAGEYVGLATKGLTAVVAYPELNTGGTNVDLGRAQITQSCTQAMALIDPDNLWECTCSCAPEEFSFVSIVGCATSSATTASAACAQVCPGAVCGGALACTLGTCQSASSGQLLSSGSCAVSDGPSAGAAPASAGDYRATNDGTSTAVLHFGAQTSTTALSGNAFMNVSTSPPTTNAAAEISRFNVTPADVFVGGEVNAMVRNIKVAHRSRLRGVFTDSTHFRFDPGMFEVIMTLQTEPSEGELSAPLNIRASNPTPIAGVVNLAGNTFSIDGTVADGSGNSMDIHFHGTITSRPPDTDGDGIIDAVDKCPSTTFGPDRIAPTFTLVPPALTTSSCSNVNIGQAQATDPCGVTVTSNKPTTFPLGTTIVTWKAVDGAGNTAFATQKVTTVLGDTASCCPAGTNVILGTSNNNTISGTSGSDCILALGGQDTVNGGGGNDFISGGDGNDIINGQAGNDRLYGGTGQDVISGGLGNDFLDGGDGVDQVNGDDGTDTLSGGQGGDILRGGTGNDVIDGGADDDQAFGGDGDDVISGGSNNDALNGENGNDLIAGGDGDDTLNGGTGTNTLEGGLGHNTCIDNGVTLLVCGGDGH